MSRFVVYCHTNKENGKKYVGITSQNPEKRWRNGEGYKNNEYFYRAIQKYGWHNFTHEILYTGLSVSVAEAKEKELIKEYGCYMPENGYNIQLGGNSGVKFTQESKRKISLALSGKPKSDEHKIHLGMARMGHAVDESTRRKLKERNSGEGNPMWGRKRDISCYRTKACMCVETGESYISTCDAARKTGIDQGCISKACNGKHKTAGGLHWSFLPDGG